MVSHIESFTLSHHTNDYVGESPKGGPLVWKWTISWWGTAICPTLVGLLKVLGIEPTRPHKEIRTTDQPPFKDISSTSHAGGWYGEESEISWGPKTLQESKYSGGYLSFHPYTYKLKPIAQIVLLPILWLSKLELIMRQAQFRRKLPLCLLVQCCSSLYRLWGTYEDIR